jgi:glycosyltransferase involved in cell wall biosynthesis
MMDVHRINWEALPKLLYFGDTPIEDYMAFSVLYRVLEIYPKNKLVIVEGDKASAPNRRIVEVNYERLERARVWARLLGTRLNRYLSPLTTAYTPLRAGALARLVRDFRPEAVMTLVCGYAWGTAAAYAERAGLPLHIIVHDAWGGGGTGSERRLVDRRLQHWYPKAASRLCVSPYMAEEFRGRYGASADILYPSRSANSIVFAEPPDRLSGACEPFTVAFAGRIQWDYANSLQRMANALRRYGGRLLVYGEVPPEVVPVMRLEPNIDWRGRVDSSEVIRQCRAEAHAMYIPMPYREQDRPNAEVSFPSKLADYTAVGLPLIVDGPEYCSAVRWARECPDVAEVITDNSVEAMAGAVARLLEDPPHRLQLADAAICRGEQYFGFDRAVSVLYSKLSGSRQSAEGLHYDDAQGMSLARNQPQ